MVEHLAFNQIVDGSIPSRPTNPTSVVLLAFAVSHFMTGVLLQFFVWDPAEKALVLLGPPTGETLFMLTLFTALSAASFRGGLWFGRRRHGRAIAPGILRAGFSGVAAVVFFTLLIWALAEPLPPPTMVEGGMVIEHVMEPASTREWLAALAGLILVPAALGFAAVGRHR